MALVYTYLQQLAGPIGDAFRERQEQITQHKFSAAHDDELDAGELAAASSAYALAAADLLNPHSQGDGCFRLEPPDCWPWSAASWKPSVDARKMLVKSIALALAEIERIDRVSQDPEALP